MIDTIHAPRYKQCMSCWAGMTTVRRFTCDDLFNYNNVNLDFFTETVRLGASLCVRLLWRTLACT